MDASLKRSVILWHCVKVRQLHENMRVQRLLQFWCLILVAWYVNFFLVCNFVFSCSLVCVILCFLMQSHV